MLNIKWRVKGLIEYFQFQRDVYNARFLARKKYKGGASPICFIAGCGRSGTTFLGRILSMHPEIAYLEEPRSFWIAVNSKTDVWGYSSVPDESLSLMLDSMPAEQEKKRFANLFYTYGRETNSRILVEKTPENVFRVPWLSQLDANAKLIHIIRNGEDVARSIAREADRLIPYGIKDMDNWYGRKLIKIKMIENTARSLSISDDVISACRSSIEWGALEWICSMRSMRKYGESFPAERQITVRYEDIMNAPWDNYSELLNFLEVNTDGGLRKSIEEYVSPRRHKKKPVELSGYLKKVFKEELERAGYV